MAFLNLGATYFIVGDFHRAEEQARQALRILLATLPPSHPLVCNAQTLVCNLKAEMGKKS
jgi:hypothetical protein